MSLVFRYLGLSSSEGQLPFSVPGILCTQTWRQTVQNDFQTHKHTIILGSHHTLKKQLNNKTMTRARKMAQQDKAPTADQPPGSHTVGGENQLLRTSVNTILGVKTVQVLCDLRSQPEALPASCQHA